MKRIRHQPTPPTEAVDETIPCSRLPWNESVWGVNHLFFAILDYLECPSSLAFSPVHKTWSERLWPHRLLIHPSAGEDRSRKISKRARLRERWAVFRQSVEGFVAEAPLTRPITSLHTTYGSQATTAVFRCYPKRIYHHRRFCEQFFLTYPRIRRLELRLPVLKFGESRLSLRAYSHAIHVVIERTRELCDAWYQYAQVEKRDLHVIGPYETEVAPWVQAPQLHRFTYTHHSNCVQFRGDSFAENMRLVHHARVDLTALSSDCQFRSIQRLCNSPFSVLRTLELHISTVTVYTRWDSIRLNLDNQYPCLEKLAFIVERVDFPPTTVFASTPQPYPLLHIVGTNLSRFKQLHVSECFGLHPSSVSALADNGTEVIYLPSGQSAVRPWVLDD